MTAAVIPFVRDPHERAVQRLALAAHLREQGIDPGPIHYDVLRLAALYDEPQTMVNGLPCDVEDDGA